MARKSWLITVVALVAASAQAAPTQYQVFRYTGFGVADSARDLRIVDDFHRRAAAADAKQLSPDLAMVAEDPRARAARIDELQRLLAEPTGSSRPEQLRRKARESELARLQQEQAAPAVAMKAEAPREPEVVVLVDTIPDGVDLKDGRISSSGEVEILGHVLAKTRWEENESSLVSDLKLLAAAAGGNVVVLSYFHGVEAQGRCRGAAALILKVEHFDPTHVSRGKLPSEI